MSEQTLYVESGNDEVSKRYRNDIHRQTSFAREVSKMTPMRLTVLLNDAYQQGRLEQLEDIQTALGLRR